MVSLAPLKSVTLYAGATPNGQKATIYLEELKAAYPESFDYQIKELDFAKYEQKEPWYLKINPNGRIPAIVHTKPDGTEFPVFESAAIYLYLSDAFDKNHKLTFPRDSDDYSEMLQWIFFAHGGVGPMQGQAIHFTRFAPEKIPYAIARYTNETRRLYSILDARLKDSDREYLAGPGKGKFSLADINVWPWVYSGAWSGVEGLEQFPHLTAWIERIKCRPGVQAGQQLPGPPPWHAKPGEDDSVAELLKGMKRANAQGQS